MSPTWSRVIPPVCRLADDDIEMGRTAPTASIRSCWVTRAAPRRCRCPRDDARPRPAPCRSAAATAASRRTATRSAATNPGVRSATALRSMPSAGRHVDQQATQQLGTRPQVRQRQAQLAVGEVGRAQPRVDRLGRRRRGDQREVRRRDGRAQGVEDERRQRRRVGGGQQGVDVGEQQDGGRVRARGGAGGPDHVVHPRRRGRGLEGGDRGGGELDAAGADGRGGAPHERRLADPLGAGDEHTRAAASRRGG